MGARSLMQRIIDLLDAASGPLTAADIQRRLVGDIGREEVACRLAILKRRGRVVVEAVPSQAITGPRVINAYSLVREEGLF